MLHKEYKELDIEIKKLDKSLQKIYDIIYDIISNHEKSYTLSFRNKSYKTFVPFSQEDKDRLESIKSEYLKKIFSHVLTKRSNKLQSHTDSFLADLYEVFYMHAGGEDAAQFKASAEAMEAQKEIIAEKNKKWGKKRPLDVNSWYVATQMLSEEDQEKIEDMIRKNASAEEIEKAFPEYAKCLRNRSPEKKELDE